MTTKAREKISTCLESLEFYNFFDVYLTKFENYQILPNKISDRFLLTTKLFERPSLIPYLSKLKCLLLLSVTSTQFFREIGW
jgi:hypothetical protein